MSDFQIQLNGEEPTIRSTGGKTADPSGVNFATEMVKTATGFIGSGYAEAQAQKAYDAAANSWQKNQESVSNYVAQLGELTTRYNTSGRPPELLAQISALEDTVRRARLGENAGSLSGIGAKAMIDSAYKNAINKFPIFSSELRLHYDSYTSTGAVGAMLQQSEMQSDMARREAEAMSTEMNKYGLSYANPADRLAFSMQAKRLGMMKMRNEQYTAEMQIPLAEMALQKSRIDLEASKANYEQDVIKFNNYLTDRPEEVAKRRLDYEAAKANYEQGNIKFNDYQEDRPREQQRRDLEFRGAQRRDRIDAATEGYQIESARENARSSKYSADYAEATYQDRVDSAKYETADKKYTANQRDLYNNSQSILMDISETVLIEDFMPAMQNESMSVEDRISSLYAAKSKATGKINEVISKNRLNPADPRVKYALDNVETQFKDFQDLIKNKDPLIVKKRLAEYNDLVRQENLWSNPDINSMELLSKTGALSVAQSVNKMIAEASAEPVQAVRDRKMGEAFAYATSMEKVYAGVLEFARHPKLLTEQFANLYEGKKISPAMEGIVSHTVQSSGTLPQEKKQELANSPAFTAALESASFGLQNLASPAVVSLARIAPEGKSKYVASFKDQLSQLSALLPDGYAVRSGKGGSLDVVEFSKDGGGSVTVVGTFGEIPSQQRGSLIGTRRSFGIAWKDGKKPDVFHGGFDADQFDYDAGFLVKARAAAGDLLGDSEILQVRTGAQNKNFTGTVKDVVSAGIDYVGSLFMSKEDEALGEALSGGGIYKSTSSRSGRSEDDLIKTFKEKGSQYADAYQEAGRKYGVDPVILMRQGFAESRYDTNAGSPAGAKGIAQFMPQTAKDMNLDDPSDAYKSIDAQAKYYKWLRDYLEKSSVLKAANVQVTDDLVLAAYNAGVGQVEKYLGVPPFKETKEYLQVIIGR